MPSYLIIDLDATRKVGAVMFWTEGSAMATANPAAAMQVPESYLNNNLDRFDNGQTTQAVLKDVADERKDRLDSILNFPLKKQVAA